MSDIHIQTPTAMIFITEVYGQGEKVHALELIGFDDALDQVICMGPIITSLVGLCAALKIAESYYLMSASNIQEIVAASIDFLPAETKPNYILRKPKPGYELIDDMGQKFYFGLELRN